MTARSRFCDQPKGDLPVGRLIVVAVIAIIVVFSMNSCDHARDVKNSLWDNEQH